MRAPSYRGDKPGGTAVIHFSLAAREAHFTNNVVFKLVDEAEIKMADSCNLLESIRGLSDRCAVPYELVNFFDLENTYLTIEMKNKEVPFSIELVAEGLGQGHLLIENPGQHGHNGKMFTEYFGKLIAKSGQEEVEKSFLVSLCRDGLYVDFGEGESPELKFYYEPETEEMVENRFFAGWAEFDYEKRRLIVGPPDRLIFSVEDNNNGYSIEILPELVVGRFADHQLFSDCRLRAQKPLPYVNDIEGILNVSCYDGDDRFYNEEKIKIKPDTVWYYDEFDAQFAALHNKFHGHFSDPVAEKAMQQLEFIRGNLSLSDLQLYERRFLEKLQEVLVRDSVEAMASANNWDWIVELGRAMLADPQFSVTSIPGMTFDAAVKATTRNIDGFLEFPKPPEYKKIVVWYTLFTVYRFFWHWYYDTDPYTKKPLGIKSACYSAVRDVTLKSVMDAGLKEYLREYRAKGMPLEARSSTDRFTSKGDIEAFDQLANEAMESFVALLKYLDEGVTDAVIKALKTTGIL